MKVKVIELDDGTEWLTDGTNGVSVEAALSIGRWMEIAQDVKKEFHYSKCDGLWRWSDRHEDEYENFSEPFPNFLDCVRDAIEPYLEESEDDLPEGVEAVCENCGKPCDYDSELCLCDECEKLPEEEA
jgi:hypothetical protein